MTQTEPVTGAQDWTGRTVRGRDGSRLGTLVEVRPGDGSSPSGWGVVRSTFGKRRLVPLDGASDGDDGLTVAADRASVRTAPVVDGTATEPSTTGTLQQHYTGRGVLADARALQHERYGGAKLGSAFFGWLVAIAVTVLLTGIVGAIVAALSSTTSITQSEAEREAGTIGVAAAITLIVVLMLAYYAGGYVAGRMSRFDGTKQGIWVWVIGLLVTIIAIGLGAIFGTQYNILDRVQLPRIPVSTDDLSMGGIITAIAVLVLTLLAAMAGGAIGHRYHNRVDRVAGI